jgi:hypothetical protein
MQIHTMQQILEPWIRAEQIVLGRGHQRSKRAQPLFRRSAQFVKRSIEPEANRLSHACPQHQ